MFRKKTDKGTRVGTVNAGAHAAAMLDIIALAASLIFLLAACTASKPESGRADDTSPALSDSPPVTAEISTDTATTKVPYPEYALMNRYGGDPLHLGVQEGAFPWRLTFDVKDESSYTSGDMHGTVFHRVNGDRFRLFYHHIEETSKDVVSAVMTTLDTYETARGLKRGDSIEKLLGAYDEGLLHVPEPFPISRDLGGAFCVYDELFVYTHPEDNNCCIVFYITSNLDSKFITGIQINLGQDGGPTYFADDVNTFAIDYSSLDQYLKTDTSDEEKVHKLLDRLQLAQGPGTAGDDISVTDVLEAMADINWGIYSQLYTTDAHDALEWLYLQKLTSAHDILCVLKATKGLDGAYSETYSGILANIYREDARKFIQVAAGLDPTEIENIALHICYDLSQDMDEVIPQLEGYQKSGELNEMEQLVVSDILRYFELWYTNQ